MFVQADFENLVIGRVVPAKTPGSDTAVCICGFDTRPIPGDAPSQQPI